MANSRISPSPKYGLNRPIGDGWQPTATASQRIVRRRSTPESRESLAGSKRAANVRNGSAQPCEAAHSRANGPHVQSDPVPSVVHLATLELACHAGGRGFESRRSRPRSKSGRFAAMTTSNGSLLDVERSVSRARAGRRRPGAVARPDARAGRVGTLRPRAALSLAARPTSPGRPLGNLAPIVGQMELCERVECR
jgi:hypothetical protein